MPNFLIVVTIKTDMMLRETLFCFQSLTQSNNKFQIEKHLVFCRWQILVFHSNRLQWCSHGRSGFVGSLQSALQKRVLKQRRANPSLRVNHRELTFIFKIKNHLNTNLLTYMGVFVFMVVRGVCQYYRYYRNELYAVRNFLPW